MGLDITAYKNLFMPATCEDVDEDELVDFYDNKAFPGSFDGLIDGISYEFEDSFEFRAGSYGGYNEWRCQLARLVGTIPERVWAGDRPPFWELINFSDCEGTIGPKVSAKLAGDFVAWQEKADQHDDEYFRARYGDWRRAFEMASTTGAVDFH